MRLYCLFNRILLLATISAGLVFHESSALAQTNTGTVSGAVLDSLTGRPVAGVSISINGQSSDQNISGTDGRFAIKLSPGNYTLRFSANNYASVDVTDVAVVAGETTEASTVISNKGSITTIEVVEKVGAVDATAGAMLQERKLSAVVSDSIGREELAATASSDAAGALQKVTGVSVVGSGFVYVRGLGERYSATQLNGAVIPTTEPEKRVVPLDMFPSGMIESIKIAKTYSPDLPAEFSGGLVQLQTVEFPTQKMFSVTAKGGFNTMTTFDKFLTYPGGGTDFFGFGSSPKGIPSLIPNRQAPRARTVHSRSAPGIWTIFLEHLGAYRKRLRPPSTRLVRCRRWHLQTLRRRGSIQLL